MVAEKVCANMTFRAKQFAFVATIAILTTLTGGKIAQAQSRYFLTLTNLTSAALNTGAPLAQTGQRLSPPVFVTHDASYRMFALGQTASLGIQNVAESGNRTPLLNEVNGLLGGSILNVAAPLSAPLPQQDSVTVSVVIDDAHPFLSLASMLGWTNDGFVGVDSLDLSTIKGSLSLDLIGFDAGTELNNERSGFLGAIGNGNARDPENGVITAHTGIRGDVDAPSAWNWLPGSPARLTIIAAPEPGSIALISLGILSFAGISRRQRNAA